MNSHVPKNTCWGAKLVRRGLIWRKSVPRAAEKTLPVHPYNLTQEATDKDYDDAVLFCLQHLDSVELFIGTHNEASCLRAVKYMQGAQHTCEY